MAGLEASVTSLSVVYVHMRLFDPPRDGCIPVDEHDKPGRAVA
jgi:hypothetical protein